MYTPSPNAKFEHAFAIVRLEVDWPRDMDINQHIVSVKQIVGSMEEAEKEVERLNKINSNKGYRYHWEITRLNRIVQVETSTDQKCSTEPEAENQEARGSRKDFSNNAER